MPQSEEYLSFVAKYPPLLAIGNTPTVKVNLPLDVGDAEIYIKYEHHNPGGSIKHRPALKMLVEAILSG